jgi:hypothetical protein
MKTLLLAGVSLVGALAFGSAALADVEVGTLTCHQQPGWGYFIGSSRRLSCVFSNASGESRYVGRMTEAGVDVGYHGDSQMVWAVFAPTHWVGPGALEGQYGGATAGGAVGLGVAASGLVGGSDRSIALQPFSVAGKTGLHVTAGIQGMTLIYEPPRTAWAPAPYQPPYAPPHAHAHAHAYAPHASYAPIHAAHAPAHARRHAKAHHVCSEACLARGERG